MRNMSYNNFLCIFSNVMYHYLFICIIPVLPWMYLFRRIMSSILLQCESAENAPLSVEFVPTLDKTVKLFFVCNF